jgi:hypothetical protein
MQIILLTIMSMKDSPLRTGCRRSAGSSIIDFRDTPCTIEGPFDVDDGRVVSRFPTRRTHNYRLRGSTTRSANFEINGNTAAVSVTATLRPNETWTSCWTRSGNRRRTEVVQVH